MDNERSVVGVKDAADIAGVHHMTIRHWIKVKKLKASQPGSTGRHRRGGARIRIKVTDLRACLNAMLDERLSTYEAAPAAKEPT